MFDSLTVSNSGRYNAGEFNREDLTITPGNSPLLPVPLAAS